MKPPKITDARKLCEALGARSVIVIAFEGNRYAAASYGETRAACASTGKTLDAIVGHMDQGFIAAPEVRGG